ncbi:unnamed protein product [Kluyveromyces dobzhanskii CBS 2104]|uniref:WGS project CCBQ000000000 data, contig 00017 n=1 Tax=Kluyveromyces dobzhanskii CBS 2104 TaxID=1427455 RepID=A0A0A8L6N1_9SACH|nr:unnamed protein product [Kluyveromyces dobzhanskii CBS 2104]
MTTGGLIYPDKEPELYSSESDFDDENDTDIPYYEQTVNEIRDGDQYVCMICTVELDSACHMYACDSCYRVFDYECVREWALKSTNKTADKSWKCPNCYKLNHKVPAPKRSTCWCGKVVNPEVNDLDPNSCGQTCNAKACVHGCSKICHLGPHPECLIPVHIKCKCGKHSKQIPCSKSKVLGDSYDCGEVCDLLMPCGKHTCEKTCHTGLCGPCQFVILDSLPCYCGSESKPNIKCSDLNVIDYSKDASGKEWIGVYPCPAVRTLHYSCDKHTYVEYCTSPPSIDKSQACPFSPRKLKTCPCGKNMLKQLDRPRRHCTDPIPTCDNVCEKPLSCGVHRCPYTCHTGDCMDPCLIITKTPCTCHSKTFLTPCQLHDTPHCNVKCESNMSCRRHKCMEICCTGKPTAKKRDKSLFLKKDRNDETLVEPEHICLKQCNLKLSCELHDCTWKCHPGKCPPCLESDPNDLVCPCGKTIVPAPVRCGTKLPPCPNPCIKISEGPAACGHRLGPHKCHAAGTECPPCTANVLKKCRCYKQQEMRTLCLVPADQVTCGTVCDKPLLNCHHKCLKKCHITGDCDTKCTQPCQLKRDTCGHPCKERCHGKLPCPQKLCHEMVIITCDCNRRTMQVECGATSETPSNSTKQKLACDDACATLQRHMELMEAFGMNAKPKTTKEQMESFVLVAKNFDDLKLPYSELTLTIYKRQTRWCDQISTLLNEFIDEPFKLSLHLKPMREPQRQFVHELASAYSFYSESQDREPNRSVYLKKVKSQSKKPDISLEEASELYQQFKTLEKARMQEHYASKVTKTYVNIQVPETSPPPPYQGVNAIVISGVYDSSQMDVLKPVVHDFLKYTLVKSPQYKFLNESNSVLIYPEDLLTMTENSANDMKKVVPFIKTALQEQMLASEISTCQVDGNFTVVPHDS